MNRRRKRTWGVAEQKVVAAAQQWRCNLCRCLLPASYELDHIRPLCDGGEDDALSNAQALCGTCHNQKSQRERIDRTRQRRSQLATRRGRQKRRPVQDCSTDNPFLRFAYPPGL